MYNCINCRVNVYKNHSHCPLCGKFLGDSESSEIEYPEYKEKPRTKRHLFRKLLLFTSIVVVAVSVFVNIFTYNLSLNLWSIIVSCSLASLWGMAVSFTSKKISTGGKILIDYGIISAMLIVVDSCTGFFKWSTTYTIPFLTILVAFIFTIIAVGRKNRFKEYFGYLLAIFFISFCPIIIYAFSLSTKVWSSLVAVLYCMLTAVGLLIFMDDNLKDEIRKRFHL